MRLSFSLLLFYCSFLGLCLLDSILLLFMFLASLDFFVVFHYQILCLRSLFRYLLLAPIFYYFLYHILHTYRLILSQIETYINIVPLALSSQYFRFRKTLRKS